jgi:OOP family OmpA-OmpF porin
MFSTLHFRRIPSQLRIAAALAAALPLLATPGVAAAGPSDGEASGSVSLGTAGTSMSGDANADAPQPEAKSGRGKVKASGFDDAEKHKPWIKRYAPERHMVEIGAFGGLWLPSRNHEVFEADPALPQQGYKDLRPVNADVGGRLGYFPLRFFGIELETALMPSRTEDDLAALMWGARGHLIGQLGLWRITPFVLAGLTALGVDSSRNALGVDNDFAVHVGAGAKMYINRYFALRLDFRDTIAAKRGVDNGITNNGEVLLGVSFTLGRKKPKKVEPSDRDGDGFLDPDDKCPDTPGVAPDGCPIPDSDGDGFLDPDDKCPQEPGVAPDGCPIGDADGDGFLDPDDKCPQEPGVEPDGCPIRDTDGDGIMDPDDKCVEEPETFNQYEDSDGCPDEVPEKVKAFSGVIEGIYFDTAKDTIKPKSRKKLDEAVEVLKEYPDLTIEVSGHTDSVGKNEYNADLSRRRAESVKKYLVDHGIDTSRITTRGAGSTEPIDTNNTKEGRAKNRRIEFRVTSK